MVFTCVNRSKSGKFLDSDIKRILGKLHFLLFCLFFSICFILGPNFLVGVWDICFTPMIESLLFACAVFTLFRFGSAESALGRVFSPACSLKFFIYVISQYRFSPHWTQLGRLIMWSWFR